MPTKTQAKNALDAINILVKADIDGILPVGVNIRDGEVFPNPNRWGIIMDATGEAQAETWTNTIIANLATAGRPTPRINYSRRADDAKVIEIFSAPGYYRIFWS